jgi:F-type H+-transporting ATPase subunit epsilon
VPAAFDTFLVTPERMLWSGRATMVVARGTEGELGIMNGHVPMLLQLATSPLFIDTEGGERISVAVDGGFLHVVTREGETRVDILAESAELREEIDLDRAVRRRDEARQALAGNAEDEDAKAELAKASLRVDLRS